MNIVRIVLLAKENYGTMTVYFGPLAEIRRVDVVSLTKEGVTGRSGITVTVNFRFLFVSV